MSTFERRCARRFLPILPSLPKESSASRVLSTVPSAMMTLASGDTGIGPRSVMISLTRWPPTSLTVFSRMTWQRGTTISRFFTSSTRIGWLPRAPLS